MRFVFLLLPFGCCIAPISGDHAPSILQEEVVNIYRSLDDRSKVVLIHPEESPCDIKRVIVLGGWR